MPVARLEDPLLEPYVPEVPTTTLAARLGLSQMVKLDANETHLGPFPGAVEAALSITRRAHRYPDHGGVLLERLTARHGVGSDSIAMAHGADALIGYLATAFLRPGDEAVFGTPSFISYAQDVMRAGGVGVAVPVRPDGALDLPAMAAQVTERTRIVFVCNPNNPTGGTVPTAAVEQLVADLPRGVLVVIDEAYAEYVAEPAYGDGPALGRSGARPNVVVLRTFSKLFGLAGLRIGYLVGPPAIVTAVRRLRHWYDVSDAAHLAAAASLDDPGEIVRRRDSTAEARARLVAVLARHGLAALPSSASFVAVPVTGSIALATAVAEQGVMVRAIPDEGYELLRVAAGTADEVAALDAALARIDLAPYRRPATALA